MDERLKEWLEIGQALARVNPARFDEVLDVVREIVETQAILAEHDDQLVLRQGRPAKRYSA